ncbi:MAG: diguanylate cyclase [Gammaproteobacteria bacterium]|nr:diguanylate cyclase [Gammaproteobacteria bacterium]
MYGIFPKDDPDQVIILKRFFIAAASYLLALGVGLYGVFSGHSFISRDWLPIIITGLVATNIYFYLIIRTGVNKRFAERSLSFSQIVVSLTWMLFLMFTDAQNRGVLLSVYIMIMMFGLFRLRRRQMFQLSVFALCGFSTIVAIDYFFFPFRFDLAREALRLIVLSGMLLWATLFAGHVSELRAKLRRRNHELSTALEEIGKLASHDDLTQAYNRRYIMEALVREKARADRTKSCFSLCILDLDHFKLINDRYGHLSGDRVLMAFSERIRGTLRGMDLVDTDSGSRFFGRYGGEEFIVVMPDTPLAGAMRCAERIRKVTEEEAFDEVFRVTLSAGVSQYHPGESIEDTLHRADAALYEAKHRGRNRVIAEDHSASSEYELPVGDSTITNIVVGPFGAKTSF